MILTFGIEGSTHEVHHAHTRYLYGLLKTEEDALMSTFLRLQSQKVLSIKEDAARGDLVSRMSHYDIAERTLSRSVQSHDGMHLAIPDGEVHTLQYFLAIDAGMQVLNLQHNTYFILV